MVSISVGVVIIDVITYSLLCFGMITYLFLSSCVPLVTPATGTYNQADIRAALSKAKHCRVFFSKTTLHLPSECQKTVSCDRQLENSCYSRIQDLILDRINYISNY